MTGPRISTVHPHRTRARLLLPFLGVILLSPLACTSDQPTENSLPGVGVSAATVRLHPYIMGTGVGNSTQSGSPRPSLSLAVAALGTGTGPKVLILADADGASTNALASSIASAGYQVTVRPAPENTWDGTNPDPAGFAAIIHLDGFTWAVPMPIAGQTALSTFVQNGGGFVGAQWIGYEAFVGQQRSMPNLVLQRSGGQNNCDNCLVTYNTVSGQEGHPVLAGIPASFSFKADGHDAGLAVLFATDPSSVLMQVPGGNPAVLVRSFGSGKVVNFSFAPNYGWGGAGQTLLDPNVQRLYLNSLQWMTGWVPELVKDQTITFAPLPARVFGEPAFSVTATASSGLTVSFTSAGNCTVSGTTVTLTGAGSCTVTAHQEGDASYHPAADVAQSFAIAKATATLTVGTEFVFDGTAKQALITTNPAGLTGVTLSYTLNGTPVATPINAGIYQVLAHLENPNYQAADARGTLTIKQATPAILWAQPAPIVAGTSLGAAQLNATATGVGGSGLSGSYLYNPQAGTVLGVGPHMLSVQFTPSDGNYTAGSKSVQISVIYRFAGFFRPVKNPPVVNTVRAGRAIPIKFSVGGYVGLGVLQAGSPTSINVACSAAPSESMMDDDETEGRSGLHADGFKYTYVWKTSKTWAGSCRKLVLTLADGTAHEALFRFAKTPSEERDGERAWDKNKDREGNRDRGRSKGRDQ